MDPSGRHFFETGTLYVGADEDASPQHQQQLHTLVGEVLEVTPAWHERGVVRWAADTTMAKPPTRIVPIPESAVDRDEGTAAFPRPQRVPAADEFSIVVSEEFGDPGFASGGSQESATVDADDDERASADLAALRLDVCPGQCLLNLVLEGGGGHADAPQSSYGHRRGASDAHAGRRPSTDGGNKASEWSDFSFATSAAALNMSTIDPMLAPVSIRDDPTAHEVSVIAADNAALCLPSPLGATGREEVTAPATAVLPATLVRLQFPMRGRASAGEAVAPGRVDAAFAADSSATWTMTGASLRRLSATARLTLADGIPKAFASVVVAILADHDRLPYVAAMVDTPLRDLGCAASVAKAVAWHEGVLARCRHVLGRSTEQTERGEAAPAITAQMRAWATSVCSEAEMHLCTLRGPSVDRETERWADITGALREAFLSVPATDTDMVGLPAPALGSGGGPGSSRPDAVVDRWLGLSLTHLGALVSPSCKVASLVGSPAALAAEADMLGGTSICAKPLNVAGPRLPLPLTLVFTRLVDFEGAHDAAMLVDARAVMMNGRDHGSRRAPSRSAKFASSLGRTAGAGVDGGDGDDVPHFAIPRPLQESHFNRDRVAKAVYGALSQQARTFLKAATAQGAQAIVVPPLLRVHHSTLLFGLEADDIGVIVRPAYSALFDVLESGVQTRATEAGHGPSAATVTVFVCGEELHPWAVREMSSKPRRFAGSVVVHEGDSHSLAANLVEHGTAAALVVPADLWTTVLGRPCGELRLFPRACDAHVRSARAAHFPHLNLVAATTTLLATSWAGASAFKTAAHIDDSSDRPYGPEAWGPLDYPESASALGVLR